MEKICDHGTQRGPIDDLALLQLHDREQGRLIQSEVVVVNLYDSSTTAVLVGWYTTTWRGKFSDGATSCAIFSLRGRLRLFR